MGKFLAFLAGGRSVRILACPFCVAGATRFVLVFRASNKVTLNLKQTQEEGSISTWVFAS